MIRFILALLVAGILLPGCSSISHTMREPNAHVEFEAADFEYSDQVTGSANSVRILGLDFTRLFLSLIHI